MKTRYNAWMNNIGLQDIDDSIYVVDIVERDPDEEIIKAERSMSGGTRFIRVNRHALSVVIRFVVREHDPARRADIVSRVRAWAKEGYLTTSDKPGKRLYVVCEYLPMVEGAMRWHETLELTLTAYDVPWWEDTSNNCCTIEPNVPSNGTTYIGSSTLYQPGTTEAPVDVTVTAKSAMDTFRIDASENKYYKLEGLGMKGGDVLTITHDERGINYFKVNGASVLKKRTADSQDNVVIPPGHTTLTVRAGGPCKVVCSVRGRYL